MNNIEKNKDVVKRFNYEFLEQGNIAVLDEIVSDDFVNRTAAIGIDPGKAGLIEFIEGMLRPAFSDIKVLIHDQIAEGDLVATRKSIFGTHTGTIMSIIATGRKIEFNITDFVRVVDGKYVEHWGSGNVLQVIKSLADPQN